MKAFWALPDEQRMALRAEIERRGGYVHGYFGEGVVVALPRDKPSVDEFGPLPGLEYVPGSGHWFPLGSDNPPDSLRHDGPYYGSRGYWQYVSYRPI